MKQQLPSRRVFFIFFIKQMYVTAQHTHRVIPSDLQNSSEGKVLKGADVTRGIKKTTKPRPLVQDFNSLQFLFKNLDRLPGHLPTPVEQEMCNQLKSSRKRLSVTYPWAMLLGRCMISGLGSSGAKRFISHHRMPWRSFYGVWGPTLFST